TLAESVLAGAQMLGITELERVETGQRYILDERLSEADAQAIAQALLYNAVIQDYEMHKGPVGAHFIAPSTSLYSVPEGAIREGAIKCAPTSAMTDEQLMELSRKGLLSLNLD